jgi:hypothetical protein
MAILRSGIDHTSWRIASKTLTLDGTTPVTLFTVTGGVECTVVGYCTTLVANVAQNLSVGIAGTVQAFIANTLASDIDAGEFWVDATPASIADTLPATQLLGNGQDIIYTGHATANSGVIEFSCIWRPLSSTGVVIAA